MVWVYQGFFNFACMSCPSYKASLHHLLSGLAFIPGPTLYSYPAEIQTYSTRSKGILIWNTASQLCTIYVTYVDSVALGAIGSSLAQP
jgi:hypothetical protein